MNRKKQVYVNVDKLCQVKKMYEAQHPAFKEKFGDSMTLDCALDHVLGKEINIQIKRNKVTIK